MPTPIIQSDEFLITSGRALARWWNENAGPALPVAGEVYMGWWRETMHRLENDWPGFGPGDVWEQLQHYRSEAREWADRQPRYRGPAPPIFSDPQLPSALPSTGGIALVVAAVALLVFVSRR